MSDAVVITIILATQMVMLGTGYVFGRYLR